MRKIILEITAFSAGICGVWTRVFSESKLLSKKGYDVHVFSSDIFRGGEQKIALPCETQEGVKITRFPAKASFGTNTFFWNFEKEALALKPDMIIVHAYRQYYSTNALKIAKKLGIPCFLVTHAPFLEKKLRNWKLNLAVSLYDRFIGRRILNKYKKIIAITNWEIPYLLALGCKKENIILIPNGIPEEFFKIPIKNSKKRKILFLGRIAPIKDIETLVKAFSIVKSKFPDIELDLVGPAEEDYKKTITELISHLGIKVNFICPVYDLKEKISLIDSSEIFVLPSKREAMPQALIEAMSREKLVISSKTDGGKEIIQDNKNGLLFEIGDEKGLADKILYSLENASKIKSLKKNARTSVKKFSWNTLIKDIEATYSLN